MPIPEHNDDGLLPPGEWEASWDEIEKRFGTNFRRREIIAGLRHVADQLRAHGVKRLWLDGSFTSDKLRPNDVDVVYEIEPGADETDWHDVGPSRRQHMKKYHRVDLWRYPSWQPPKGHVGPSEAANLITIKEYFESTEDGTPRGLVLLRLEDDDQE